MKKDHFMSIENFQSSKSTVGTSTVLCHQNDKLFVVEIMVPLCDNQKFMTAQGGFAKCKMKIPSTQVCKEFAYS